jgi:hypothetical protein
MGKEQISIRLIPEVLQKIDEFAAVERRTRNNMIEVLIWEAIEVRLSEFNDRLFEQIERLEDRNLTKEALDEEVKRTKALIRTKGGRPPKKSDESLYEKSALDEIREAPMGRPPKAKPEAPAKPKKSDKK